MIIGCVKETMPGEGRVSLVPDKVLGLLNDCKDTNVFMEKSAGVKSGFADLDYCNAGAFVGAHDEVVLTSDLLLTVKGPSEIDAARLTGGDIVGGFIHGQNNPLLCDLLLTAGATVIDYGSIQRNGKWHILAKMSEFAGEIAVSDGGYFLHKYKGKIIGPGTTVGVIGMGIAGNVAAEKVLYADSYLYAFDKSQAALEAVQNRFNQNYLYKYMPIKFDPQCPEDMRKLAEILPRIDLLIGCIRNPSRNTGRPVPREVMRSLTPGSVVVDISIDDGGCFGPSRKTSAEKPIFQDKATGVIYYCVPNMPGTIPQRATPALVNEVFPYVEEVARKGLRKTCLDNPAFRSGVIMCNHFLVNETLAQELDRKQYYKPLEEVL